MDTRKKLAQQFLTSVISFGVVIFLASWSFKFWQGWLFLGIYSLYLASVLSLRENILMRRMQAETGKHQKIVATLFALIFILNFFVLGFNYRFGWQYAPINVEIVGFVMICIGYMTMFLSLKQNEYAAANVDVESGQKVYSGGLYGFVRHPMYFGNIIVLLFMPLAFGFYWDFIVSFLLIVLLVLRIVNEEKVLNAGLVGYPEYCRKIKWRLLPFVW